jgi:hypothetical protein
LFDRSLFSLYLDLWLLLRACDLLFLSAIAKEVLDANKGLVLG